jgi:hypothetical protein
MVFGIILLIFVLLVAFIHMVQGFFSATLSAIFAVIAAAVAVGFHENVVAAMKPGKFADSANASILCCLFAGTYVALRLIFDRAVPGNMRFQSTLDKVGGATMGLIAGIFAAGVLAIAAQTLPFGPSILGYSRYELTSPDREINGLQPDRNKTALTRTVYDELKSETFKEEDKKTLLLPVDDIVLGVVSSLSEGSLSGARPLNSVHANYLQEAFATRIGIEVGAKHTATNLDSTKQVTVDKVATIDRIKQVESAEFPEIRKKEELKDTKKEPPVAGKEEAKLAKDELKPGGKEVILIVRTMFDKNATDEKGSLFRFTPASIRLVVHDPQTHAAKNYYPIGTMDSWGGGTFWPSRIDDPLFVSGGNGADLVFRIEDRDEILEGAEPPKKGKAEVKPTAAQIKENTFLEVKRLARVDLSNTTVESGPLPANPAVEVMRKTRMKAPPPPPA